MMVGAMSEPAIPRTYSCQNQDGLSASSSNLVGLYYIKPEYLYIINNNEDNNDNINHYHYFSIYNNKVCACLFISSLSITQSQFLCFYTFMQMKGYRTCFC